MRGMKRLALLGVPGAQGADGGVTYESFVQSLVTAGEVPLWYRFKNASTTLVNHGSAGAALNATLVAGDASLVYSKDGPIGTAEAWDFTVANNTAVTTPQHAALTALTNQTWIFLLNPRSAGEGGQGVLARWALTAWNIVYSQSFNYIGYGMPYSIEAAQYRIPIPETGWRGYIFEHNATTKRCKIYLLESGSVITPSPVFNRAGSGDLVAPSSDLSLFNNLLNTAGFDGLVDELIVLNRVGTPEEYAKFAAFFT